MSREKKTVSYHIKKDTIKRLSEYCEKEGMWRSFFVNKAIEEKLDRIEMEKA